MSRIAWHTMPGFVKVKLLRDFAKFKAGSTIEFEQDRARRLIEDGFADLVRDHTPSNKRARPSVVKGVGD